MALSLAEKTRLRRMIDRQWMGSLPGAEYSVLLFIFTMTTEWGKYADRLKLDHFVNGIGEVRGLRASKMTVRRALSSMTERGVILRERTPYGYIYAINFDWEPDGRRHGDYRV
jgi:hypothetical protein